MQDAVYYPLLDSVNIWTLTYGGCPAVPSPSNSSRSYCSTQNFSSTSTGIDTIINNLNYKFLFGNSGEYIVPCLLGFISEDTTSRKIYFIYVDNTVEALLYDFSMKLGDTAYLNFQYSNINFPAAYYRVDSIKNVTISVGQRRAFFLHESEADTLAVVWLESVGWLANPIYLYRYFYGPGLGDCEVRCDTVYPYTGIVPYHNNSYVTCFSHNERVYIDICAYENALTSPFTNVVDSCTYGPSGGGVVDLSILSSFDLSPNPSTRLVTINLQVASSSEFAISILDMEGRQATSTYPLGKLETGTYDKQIDLSDLSSGFYLVECKTRYGSLYRKLVISK